MRALMIAATLVLIPVSAAAQVAEEPAWWATAELWKVAAPFVGAFLGFFGATFVNDWLHERRRRQLRNQSAKGLAMALKGQVLAAAASYKRRRMSLEKMIALWSNDPPFESDKPEIKIRGMPEILDSIFAANIQKMELIEDPEIIADITHFFSVTKPQNHEVTTASVVKSCEGWVKTNETFHRRALSIANKLQAYADSIK